MSQQTHHEEETTEHDPHGTVATVMLMLIVLGLIAIVVAYAMAS